MNKGLFIHLVVTVSMAIMWIFIVGSEDWNIAYRGAAGGSTMFINFFIWLFGYVLNEDESMYSKKIKL